MAKIKDIPLTIDDETEERQKFGGMTKAEIDAAAQAIGTQKRASSEAAGNLSAKLDIFEKQGGNKKAIKVAKNLADLEPADFADLWRTLVGYLEALGAFSQIDMIDQLREQELNGDTISAVSKKPSYAAEPVTH